MPEDPEEFYSKGAEEFDRKYSLEKMPGEYIDLMEKFLDLVDGGKVLDAGCGPGRDTEFFVENGLEAVGVDLAEGMLEQTDGKKGEYHMMDVRDLEFTDSSFDAAWCNTVIHFFPREEMREVVEELARVTRSGGVIYISFKLGDETIEREAFDSSVIQHLVPEEFALELCREYGEVVDTVKSQTPGGFNVLSVFFRKDQV
jgi:ubiquinone/menaquinone biosynthesis C-methylase UbiE